MQQHPPFVNGRQPGDHAQYRGLAAAARAEEDKKLTIGNFKRNVVDDRVAIIAFRQLL